MLISTIVMMENIELDESGSKEEAIKLLFFEY